jgi:hypothetical protein
MERIWEKSMNRLLNNLSTGRSTSNKTKILQLKNTFNILAKISKWNTLFIVCHLFIFMLQTFKITCNIDVALHQPTSLDIINA